MADLTGITIAQYKILRKLDGGNMGVVYKAEDTRLRRLVAIKFLAPELILDKKAKERFVREAQSASALDHLNICSIYEFNQTTDGKFYIVMPFYSGESLRQMLEKGALDVKRIIEIGIQLSDALTGAHTKNIIHRDIKPANIFITEDGVVKLLDFGIAKLSGIGGETSLQDLSGTVSYMSPEQILGEPVDNRTDIWSMGVVIYEMLTGQRPFGGEYTQTITYSILNDDPTNVLEIRKDIPVEFDSLIRKLLAKKVRNRYQLAMDAGTDLKKLLTSGRDSIQVPKESVSASILNKRMLYVLSGVVLILLIFIIYFWQSTQLREPDDQIITVLPLQSQSPEDQNLSISDGFTEDLILKLASSPQLSVRPWEFSLAYKNKDTDISKIRDEIGGTFFITGSFQSNQDTIVINLQLINTDQNVILWAGQFSGGSGDILYMQNEAIREITAVLIPESSPTDEPLSRSGLTAGTMAYNYYLKARGFYYRYTNPDNENSVRLYKKALNLDSTCAKAAAGLADAYAQKVLRYGAESVWLDSALARSNQALRHDGQLAEAYKARGLIYYTRSWFKKSIRANERALEINHSHAPAMANLGWAYLQTGDLQKAMQNLQKSYRLNPTNPAISTGIGFIYLILRADSDAKKWLQHAYDLQPDYQPNSGILLMMMQIMSLNSDSVTNAIAKEIQDPSYLIQSGDINFKKENLSEAARYYLKAMDINPQTWHPFTGINISTSVGTIFKQMGEDDYKILFELSRQQNHAAKVQGSEWWGIDYDMAAVSISSGETSQALQFLNDAVEKGFRFSRYLKTDPHFTLLNGNQKFQQLIRRIDDIIRPYRENLVADKTN